LAAELQIPELRVEESESDYIKLVVEPLEAGFGTTLGNSLRRVLLSSLPGAAITSVRIEGVEHEFSTIDHMQEDVTELLLNLKEVRLRSFSDRPARLYLEASGAIEVKAGDIQATADYEVVNPDLRLAILDHSDAALVMDLNVESGRGYAPATVSDGLPIGVIPVDALFTPVSRVNFNVSNTRVGQDTDFDSLEMEVWTDGSIEGGVAISLAAEILREQLLKIQQLGHLELAEVVVAEGVPSPFEGHDTPIEDLFLSVRAYNCLKRSGLTSVGMILERSEDELLALRNFGAKSYDELRDKLVGRGFPAPRGGTRRSIRSDDVGALEEGVDGGSEVVEADAESEVGSLGAALIQALREAGEESVETVENN
jgi:DNA-directed RNA polymerase subunit alpha